jgi:hypothetical protein
MRLGKLTVLREWSKYGNIVRTKSVPKVSDLLANLAAQYQ